MGSNPTPAARAPPVIAKAIIRTYLTRRPLLGAGRQRGPRCPVKTNEIGMGTLSERGRWSQGTNQGFSTELAATVALDQYSSTVDAWVGRGDRDDAQDPPPRRLPRDRDVPRPSVCATRARTSADSDARLRVGCPVDGSHDRPRKRVTSEPAESTAPTARACATQRSRGYVRQPHRDPGSRRRASQLASCFASACTVSLGAAFRRPSTRSSTSRRASGLRSPATASFGPRHSRPPGTGEDGPMTCDIEEVRRPRRSFEIVNSASAPGRRVLLELVRNVPGGTFIGWSDPDCPVQPTCTVVMPTRPSTPHDPVQPYDLTVAASFGGQFPLGSSPPSSAAATSRVRPPAWSAHPSSATGIR